MSIWTVVIFCSGTLVWAGSALGATQIATIVSFVVLVGMWCTVQFGWIYREDPELALLLERYSGDHFFPCCVSASIWWKKIEIRETKEVRHSRARHRALPVCVGMLIAHVDHCDRSSVFIHMRSYRAKST